LQSFESFNRRLYQQRKVDLLGDIPEEVILLNSERKKKERKKALKRPLLGWCLNAIEESLHF